MSYCILIVDDEPLIVKGLKFALEQDGYSTDQAGDGEIAIERAQNKEYDLILLDVMLPKFNGIEVCQRVREFSNVPIIMLTAKGDDMDKILGLEYGADDYMTKPFNILEVKARVKAILRRTHPMNANQNDKQTEIVSGSLIVNLNDRTVFRDENEIDLTAKEFDLMQLFIENPGKVFSREELLEQVWKSDYAGDLRTVDVHIRRLREKIEYDPANPTFIMTKWGIGYYFAKK